MIRDLKIFLIMLLRQLKFGALSISKLFYVYYKGKTQMFFIFSFYCCLVKQDRKLSCLAICHPEGQLLINQLPKKTKCMYVIQCSKSFITENIKKALRFKTRKNYIRIIRAENLGFDKNIEAHWNLGNLTKKTLCISRPFSSVSVVVLSK